MAGDPSYLVDLSYISGDMYPLVPGHSAKLMVEIVNWCLKLYLSCTLAHMTMGQLMGVNCLYSGRPSQERMSPAGKGNDDNPMKADDSAN